MIVGDANDIFQSFANVYLVSFFGGDNKADIAKIEDETAPTMLKLIQNLYDQNQKLSKNSGYIVGKGLTYADIKFSLIYDWFRGKKEQTLNDFTQVKAEKIRSLTQLVDQYARSDKMRLFFRLVLSMANFTVFSDNR
jgi:hypothetical protein